MPPAEDRRQPSPGRLLSIPPIGGALQLSGEGRSTREVLAGVTLAALSLPLNIGYATAAGLPATAGIYATLVPLVVFAILTGSRHLMVGPDATIAALLAAGLAPLVAAGADPTELAWASAICVGATLLAFWVFRLGGLVRFVSKPVLVGFIAGLGIEILTSQVKKILAVDVEAVGWVREVAELVGSIPDASWPSVGLGVGTIVALRLTARFWPRLPGALLVLILATVFVEVTDLEVSVLGAIPSGLPSIAFPTIGLDVWIELLGIGLAIAVLTTAEGVLIAQRYARKYGEPLDPNGEVFAFGVANVAAGVAGGMPMGASASRSAAINAVGSRTQVPAIAAVVVVVVVVLFFTDAVAQLPQAAIAGLVANAVVSTIEVHEMRRFGRLRRSELAIALGCAAGVLILGPIPGIVFAVIASAIDVVRRAADAPWARLSTDLADPSIHRSKSLGEEPEDAPGMRTIRPGGPLFFANADNVRTVLEEAGGDPEVAWVVIDFETVSDIDPTAADALLEGIEAANADRTVVALTRVTAPIRHLLDAYGVTPVLGEQNIYESNRAARAAYSAAKPSNPDHGDGPA